MPHPVLDCYPVTYERQAGTTLRLRRNVVKRLQLQVVQDLADIREDHVIVIGGRSEQSGSKVWLI